MGVRRIDPLIGGEKDMTEYASRQFSALYERYRVVVYYTALRVTRSKEAAEDVMQSVFLELMDNCERTGRIPDEVGGWLVKLAKYRSLDHVRSESRTVPTEAPEVPATPEPRRKTTSLSAARSRLSPTRSARSST